MTVKALFFCLSFVLFSCQNKEVDLRGHWHIEPATATGLVGMPTIDFVNDTFALLGKGIHGIEGFGGTHEKDKKWLTFGPTCLSVSFRYEIIDEETILLHQEFEKDNKVLTAKKCNTNCCDKQSEFFHDSPVDIDLPIAVSEICDDLFQKPFQGQIIYGIPKQEFQKEFGDTARLLLNYEFSTTADLALWEEKWKIKAPDNMHGQMHKVVYVDKATPMQAILPLLKYYIEKEEYEIYFASRRADMSKGYRVCYTKMDIRGYDWEVEMSYQNWINTNYAQ